MAALLDNNLFTECVGLLLASIATGVAIRFGFPEWKAGATAALTVIALYIAKVLFTDASLWAAFVTVLPVVMLVAWMMLVAYLLRRAWSKKQAAIRAEDRAWSENPFRFLTVAPAQCDINTGIRAVSVRIRITNRFTKQRFVCVTTNIALYRHGTETPLCTLTVPIASALVGANETVDAAPVWQATMTRAEADEVAAIYKLDGQVQVRLVQPRVTTLVDLTAEPKAVTNELAPGLVMPVDVEHFYVE